MTIYLLHITPYDPDTSAEIDVRVSMGSLTPKFDGVHWPARLISPPDVLVSVFQREAFGDRNPPRTVLGPAVVDLRDGSLDAWRGYEFDGRAFTLYQGDSGETDFGNFTVAAAGVVDSVSWTREQMTLRLADYSVDLDQPAAQSYYTGAGGTTGGSSDLTAQPRPRALGSPRNVTPTLLSATRQIYQVNDGDVNDITDVYDGGVALTDAGDTTDFDAIAPVTQTLSVADVPRPVAIRWGNSGNTLYVLSENARLYQYATIAPYTITRAIFVDSSLDLSPSPASFNFAYGIAFKSDGTEVYVMGGASAMEIAQYSMSTAWDLTTASYTGKKTYSTSDVSLSAKGIDLRSDGAVIWIADVGKDVVRASIFGTAYDVTTLSNPTAGNDLDVTGEFDPGLFFDVRVVDSSDVAYVHDSSFASSVLYRYELATSGVVSSGAFTSGDSIELADVITGAARSFDWRTDDGRELIVLDNDDTVHLIRFTTAYEVAGDDPIPFRSAKTDLSTGRFLVSSPPQFGITADVEGELDGSIFIESAADIAEYLLEEAIGSARVDSASFATVKASNSATVSLYIPTDERPKYSDIIPDILGSIGAVLRPSSDGKIGAQILEIGTPTLTLREDDIIAGSFARTEPPRPIYRMTIGYEKNWTLQRGSEINADEITAANRQFRESEYRSTSAESAAVETRFLRSRTSTFNTLLDTQAAASAEASRRLTLTGTRRDFYVISLFARQYEVRAGDTITIIHPDTRTPAGLDVLVQSVEERANGRTRIVVWG